MTGASDVAVIIPAYNSEQTIGQAVSSCVGLRGCSLIVVDDGSTDQTAAVARAAGAEVIQQANAGAWAARRLGLSVVDNSFVVFLDADDELLVAGVMESLTLLRASSSASVAAGRVIGLMPNGQQRLLPRTYSQVDAEALISKGHGPWPPAASVIRRESLQKADELTPAALGLRFAEDYEMFIRLSMTGRVLTHEQPSARYRLFSGKSSSAPLQEMLDKESIRRHYASELGITVKLMTDAEVKAAALTRAAWSSAAHGRWFNAAFSLMQSFITSPIAMLRKVRSRYTSRVRP